MEQYVVVSDRPVTVYGHTYRESNSAIFFLFPISCCEGWGSTLKRKHLEQILFLKSWPYLGRAMPSRKPIESHRKVSLTKIKKI